MRRETNTRSVRTELSYNLRTTIEVAALGFATSVVGIFALLAMFPVANFFGSWGLNAIFELMGALMWLAAVLVYVLPLAASFYYGFKRRRHLGFL